MRKKMVVCIVALVTIALSGCTVKNSENEVAAIDAVRLAYNAAYNAKSLQAMDSIFDADAIMMIPEMPSLVGKDSILAGYASAFPTSHSWLEIKAGDIQVSGDWAFLTAEYDRADTLMMGDASKVMQLTGHNLLVFKKQVDGSWKLARDIWTEAAYKSCCMNDKP